jgi:hypothetical protein
VHHDLPKICSVVHDTFHPHRCGGSVGVAPTSQFSCGGRHLDRNIIAKSGASRNDKNDIWVRISEIAQIAIAHIKKPRAMPTAFL